MNEGRGQGEEEVWGPEKKKDETSPMFLGGSPVVKKQSKGRRET